MLGFLLMLLMAAIAGFIGDALVPGRMPGGWVGAVLAGLLGGAVGGYLLGAVGLPAGPGVGGLAIIPAVGGAALLVLSLGLLSGALARSGRY